MMYAAKLMIRLIKIFGFFFFGRFFFFHNRFNQNKTNKRFEPTQTLEQEVSANTNS
jgi:hypothetical protein